MLCTSWGIDFCLLPSPTAPHFQHAHAPASFSATQSHHPKPGADIRTPPAVPPRHAPCQPGPTSPQLKLLICTSSNSCCPRPRSSLLSLKLPQHLLLHTNYTCGHSQINPTSNLFYKNRKAHVNTFYLFVV